MNQPMMPARLGRRPVKVADPGGRIRELWAIVTIDADGDETLLLRQNGFTRDWSPMVTADGRAIEMMKAQARECVAQYPHLKIEVRHFCCDDICKVIAATRPMLQGWER